MLNPTLSKNRSGKYEIRYSETQPDGSNRTRTKSTGTTSVQEAQIVLGEFILQEKQTAAALDRPKIKHVAAQYIDAATARGVSDGQLRGAQVVSAYFGEWTPDEITPEIFLQFRAFRGVSDSSLRRDLSVLGTVFTFGVKHRIWKRGDIPYIDMPPAGAPKDIWLNETQEAEFLDLAMKNSDGLPRLSRVSRFVAIGLDTGARKTAIHELTWDRVDLASGTIDFRVPGRAVTNKRRVPVPVSDRLRPVLQRAYSERTTSHVLDHVGNIRKAYATWQKGQGAAYSWVTPHVMRHTAATLMLRAGVSIWDVAGVLGDTPETVTKVYAHHAPDRLNNAVNRRV